MPLFLTLALTLLKLFLRDRQAIFFTLFFPVIFMLVFGFINNREPDPISIGLVDGAGNGLSRDFINLLQDHPLFLVDQGDEASQRQSLLAGENDLVILVPADFREANRSKLTVLVDAAQSQQLALVMPTLEQALVTIERQLQNSEPLFQLEIEDVHARSQRYIDFLVPGLLAFTLMQIAIAGSGFNIVEYRRKGILKRLFVTPLKPRDFILALVQARLVLCLVQLSILLVIAVLALKVTVMGDFFSLYAVIILGTGIFLCIGFCLGSVAKTQQSIMAIGNLIIFPQIFLSGIFYPTDILPGLIQPLANVLPLTFVANALREVAIDGASLLSLGADLVGMLLWLILAFVLAVKSFVWKEVAA